MCVFCVSTFAQYLKQKKECMCGYISKNSSLVCSRSWGTFRTVEHSVGVSYDLRLKLSHSVTDQAEHHKASLLYTLCTD